ASGAVKNPVSHLDIDTGLGNDHITNNTNVPSDLNGGMGDDVIVGGAGNDVLIGGGGRDSLSGGDGDDLIYSLGRGSDYVRSKSTNNISCGAGTDGVYATATDTVSADCDKVVRGVDPPKTGGDVVPTTGTPGTAPATGTPTGRAPTGGVPT